MKTKRLIPLALVCLLAGAFMAMPSAALADRNYFLISDPLTFYLLGSLTAQSEQQIYCLKNP